MLNLHEASACGETIESAFCWGRSVAVRKSRGARRSIASPSESYARARVRRAHVYAEIREHGCGKIPDEARDGTAARRAERGGPSRSSYLEHPDRKSTRLNSSH